MIDWPCACGGQNIMAGALVREAPHLLVARKQIERRRRGSGPFKGATSMT
jgi:hypothetical protein